MQANLYALGAIALWVSLASLGVLLQHLPPFLLTGVALLMGSLLALPFVIQDRRQWKVPVSTLALGVYGLFGFHFLLFIALRHAPAVEANLVNYLWPLFMVVLAPLWLAGVRLRVMHVVAALLGFAGAAVAILGASGGAAGSGGWSWGFVPALASAFIWASYSLLTQRVKPFPTAAIGLFGLVSGLLSLLCHWALEPAAALSGRDWLLLAVMGLGPLGGAFFLWDKALKLGDARQIGIL
ncbi:MAG: DMT family transporter, partial [Polaromonas sp.]|nr:DMT family transporter [Polaromonas sp.]